MVEIYNYYAQNGGLINGAIFLVAVAIIYIGLGKMIHFHGFSRLSDGISTDKTVYLSVVDDVFSGKGDHSAQYYKNAFREKLLDMVPRLESGLDTMATLIQVAPLLGLYGTVVGMIETFTLITTYGTSNPVILTEGITVSLLTTQAGLLVAFPCMLFHNYLTGRKEFIVRKVISQGETMVTRLFREKTGYDVR